MSDITYLRTREGWLYLEWAGFVGPFDLRVFQSKPRCGVERWSMMKKFKKHTPEQIVGKLEQAAKLKAEGKTNADVARDLKVSEATLHRWQKTYGQMDRAGARELKALRDENDRLKKLLAEAELDKAAYKELAEGNF